MVENKYVYFHEDKGDLIKLDLNVSECTTLEDYVKNLGITGADLPQVIVDNLTDKMIDDLIKAIHLRPIVAVSRFYKILDDTKLYSLSDCMGGFLSLKMYAQNSVNSLLKDKEGRIHLVDNIYLHS